ncbi:Acyl-CoA dehydrogenase [compost metagenome]
MVNGQKIWTSYAHVSDWIFLLVRTDAESKHAGISFLMVDMQTPGITVRPIVSIDDCHHFNEVFFDNVRVPVANRIGNEGDGWKLTKFLLNNEHAFTAELPRLKRYLKTLCKLAATLRADGSALIEQESFALKLARCEAELNALGILVSRVAGLEGDHSPAAHALGSMLKVRGTELQQRMTELLVDALGDRGAIAYPEAESANAAESLPGEEFARGLAAEMFFRRASTIYGGASEVQRGIIAKMLFQL